MTPRLSCFGATSSAMDEPGLRCQRTIGRWRDSNMACSASLTRQCCSTVARSGIITANGFSTRNLRWRNSVTDSGICGITSQMETTQTLYGNDFPICEQFLHGQDGITPVRLSVVHLHLPTRLVVRTPDKPPVGRGTVGRVDWCTPQHNLGHMAECGHGRIGSVVWDIGYDGKTRSAIGAIDERITVIAGRMDQIALLRQSGQILTSGEMGWKAPAIVSDGTISKPIKP